MDARSSTACRVPAAAAHGEGESCAVATLWAAINVLEAINALEA